MAHVELQLISNIIEQGDWRTVHSAGTVPDHFLTEDGHSAFRWLFDEVKKDGAVPSKTRFLRKFPQFEFCPSRDPISAQLRELRSNNIRSEALQVLEDLLEKLESGDEDPEEALQLHIPQLRDTLVEFSDSGGSLLSRAAEEMRADYDAMKHAGGIVGISYPWGPLNEETGGLQPGQFVVIFARPKMMKCVAAGQRLMMRDGRLVPIEQVPEICEVPSFTEATQQLRWARAQRVASGAKECVEIVTEDGRRVVTGTEHYFMVPEGPFEERFSRICDLSPGDWVAVERGTLPWDGNESSDEADKFWMLGALVGDGNYTRNEIQFANKDEDVVLALNRTVSRLGARLTQGYAPIEYRVVGSGNGVGSNPVLNLLREEGIWGQSSTSKTSPPSVFRASARGIAAYLAGLLDTDGTVRMSAPSRCCKWYTSSKQMAREIQHLLARIGVHASVRPVPSRNSFVVGVQGLVEFARLHEMLHSHMACTYKRTALATLAGEDLREKPHEGIPESKELRDLIMQEKGSHPWPAWISGDKLFRRTGRISRASLLMLANAWNSPKLRAVAEQERRWVKIAEITSVGVRECYDIVILDGQDPNFMVEGFLVHNTWVACAVAVHAYLDCGKRVAVYSKEMTVKQMRRRCASIIAKLDDGEIRTGSLSPEDEDHFFDVLADLEDLEQTWAEDTQRKPGLLFLSDKGVRGGSTIDSLRARVEKFEPDLLVVDGFYLMRDARSGKKDRDWKTVGNVSADIKELALEMDLPIIGTCQANRAAAQNKGGSDLSDIAFADAIGQDADIVMQVVKGKAPEGHPMLMFLFPGVRDGDMSPFVINAIPGKDFSLRSATVNVKEFFENAEKVDGRSGDAAPAAPAQTPAHPTKLTRGKSRLRK